MSSPILVRYLAPWKYKRDQERQRLAELRRRDGDACRRCRRPIRFDLTDGHDQGPKIEPIQHDGGAGEIHNLCLTHRRCNFEAADYTAEVKERIRRKAEAELLSRGRKRKTKAA